MARGDDGGLRADRRANRRADPASRRRACLALLALLPLPARARTGAAMSAAPINLATDGARWQVVNDGVMGGVSTSQIASDAQGLRFSGELRTEFNGGFASARRAVDATALRAALTEEPVGLALVVRGDGHRYRLTVYPADGRGGVRAYSYFAEFHTAAGVEQSHTLHWPAFRATFRGRAIPDAPPLAWRDVVGVGLMLTKDGHREGRGPFELHLVSLSPASPGT